MHSHFIGLLNRHLFYFQIFPYSSSPSQGVSVLCDHVSDGGQWTIIQRRKDVEPREDFDRSWEEYVEGFGDLDGEFWVGLKLIHELTTHSKQELHILLEDWEGETRWARYSNFYITSAEDNYRITVTGYICELNLTGWILYWKKLQTQ